MVAAAPTPQRHGHASPAVKYIALVQDGREDLRPLESHFGAWVVSALCLALAHLRRDITVGCVAPRAAVVEFGGAGYFRGRPPDDPLVSADHERLSAAVEVRVVPARAAVAR
jgi:hypothetical protein